MKKMTIERVKAGGASVRDGRSVSECDQEVDNEVKNILLASSDKEVDRLQDLANCKHVNKCKQKEVNNKQEQVSRPVTFHLPMLNDDNVDDDCTSSDELGEINDIVNNSNNALATAHYNNKFSVKASCSGCDMTNINQKLLRNSMSTNESSSSSLGITQHQSSQVSPRIVKNQKKVTKYYRKQSDLMENFKRDSSIIEECQRRRQKARSISRSPASDEKDLESGKLLSNGESVIDTDEENKDELSMMQKSEFEKLQPPPHSYCFKRQSSILSLKRPPEMDKAARWIAMATLMVNISLVIAKSAAAYLSGSLSIISSLVDSAVDITSGLVIWLTARAIRKRDPYMYPRGRTRLEPIALIIVSVIMGVASMQMIVQSLESVIRQDVNPHVNLVSLFIMITTVFAKFTLFLLCKKFNEPSINVLAQDHRNDCISNIVALLCAWAASKFWIYLDPIGAIIVSIYIAITWYFTGKQHLAMLSGKSAEPAFINRIVKVCVEHDPRIDYIDTVYVYHFGLRFLVEVHIVMDALMTLKTAHDISETLQTNIESLEEVERAFVHCDYEFSHMPTDEHKVV